MAVNYVGCNPRDFRVDLRDLFYNTLRVELIGMKKESDISKEQKAEALNRERAELFRKINIQMFKDLAEKKGVTVEELISATLKTYLEKHGK
jgi:hypothetical protein